MTNIASREGTMKRFVYMIAAVIMVLGTVLTAGCLNDETRTTDDVSLVFERIISGDQIREYINYGYEGLIAEYEYVEHIYHQGESFSYRSIFNTAYIYDTEASATKRYQSLYRTYKDDVIQVGNKIYLNQIYENAVVTSSIHWQLNYQQMLEQMLENGYVLISPANP